MRKRVGKIYFLIDINLQLFAIVILHSIIFSFLFAANASGNTNFQRASNNKIINLLHASGLEDQLRTTQIFLLKGLDGAVASGQLSSGAARLESELIRTLYDYDSLLHSIVNNIRLEEKYVSKLVDWYKSDLGKRIVELEKASSTIGGHQKIVSKSKTKFKEEASKERIRLMLEIQRAFPMTFFSVGGDLRLNNRISANMYLSRSKWITGLNTYFNPKNSTITNNPFVPEVGEHYLMTGLLHTYKELTDEEVKEYIKFIWMGREFYKCFFDSYNFFLNDRSKLQNESLLRIIIFSGMNEQIKNTPIFLLQGLDETIASGLDRLANTRELREAILIAYSEKNMLNAMVESMAANPGWIVGALNWYTSDLGQKIVALENSAATLEGHRKIQQQSVVSLAKQTSPERLARVQRLYEVLPWAAYLDDGVSLNHRIAGNLALAGRFSGTAFGAVASADNGLDPLNFSYPELKQEYILTGLITTYRDLSDQELDNYIEFLSSPTGNSCQMELFKAYGNALAVGSGTMAYFLADESPDPKPVSGGVTARIIKFGLLEAKPLYRKESSGTGLGNILAVRKPTITERTSKVTALLNNRFGIQYVLNGKQVGQVVSATVKVIHPSLTNPRLGYPVKIDQWTTRPTIGKVHFDGWTFEHTWEMVPGTWIFEIWLGDQALARQEFEIVCAERTNEKGMHPENLNISPGAPCQGE